MNRAVSLVRAHVSKSARSGARLSDGMQKSSQMC